ncbi:hypothetical protein P40081_29235 [Paenibacillus sp. FSL P4-0081]|nr:hypothetical protein P40081_29235 [Paenibacillus sp. FSL P4-0081]OMF26322.1 hypothetical protein BK132_18925 [Paenibacillus sp. FSL H8-0259]
MLLTLVAVAFKKAAGICKQWQTYVLERAVEVCYTIGTRLFIDSDIHQAIRFCVCSSRAACILILRHGRSLLI